MTVNLIPILVALGVLGYLTAKIQKIEELNFKIYRQVYPSKFKKSDLVQLGNCNIAKYSIQDVKFDKNEMRYFYKIIDVNNFNILPRVDERDLELFKKEQKEDKESDEDDVS